LLLLVLVLLMVLMVLLFGIQRIRFYM